MIALLILGVIVLGIGGVGLGLWILIWSLRNVHHIYDEGQLSREPNARRTWVAGWGQYLDEIEPSEQEAAIRYLAGRASTMSRATLDQPSVEQITRGLRDHAATTDANYATESGWLYRDADRDDRAPR